MSEVKIDFETALGKVIAELKAPKNQYNSFGKYKYRNAEDIVEAVKPLLHEHGLRMKMSDEIVNMGDRFYVKSTVTVKGYGEEDTTSALAREEEDKKGMDGAQVTGAASSYARKYALNGMFNIDDTKDADSQDNTMPKTSKPMPKDFKPRTEEQKKKITQLMTSEGIRVDQIPDELQKQFDLVPDEPMSYEKAEEIIKKLESKEPF